jgi:hypothetical protein
MTNLTIDEGTADYSSGIARTSLDDVQNGDSVQEAVSWKEQESIDTTDVPIEYQLYQVDMNDPKMDPLEWTIRKIVPIPKAYYWETGNTDLPMKTKAWHQIVGTLGSLVTFVDRVGKPVTDATGLSASRFDYVKSTMTDSQLAKAQKTASERKQHSQTSRRAVATEEGRDSASQDID